jgi:hypothetical protein
MPSDRWLKKVEPPKNVSQSDVRRIQQEKQARIAAVPDLADEPVNQLTTVVDQSTSLDDQLTSDGMQVEAPLLVNQLTSQPLPQPDEKLYPSRTRRTLKGIRFQCHKLEQYEEWHFKNRKRFPSFQDAVEYAMDWLTSQPVNQLTSQPVNQSTTLINNDLNNLIINDAKAQRALGKYSQVTGKPATLNDHTAYLEVSSLPVEAIERGLEETKRRADKAGKQMNSFKYALNVIREEAVKIVPPITHNAPQADFSGCPDCAGTGFWYPEGTEKGVRRCLHEKLKSDKLT